jgi:hypothetical protein
VSAKLRHANGDLLMGVAHWIGRKCRNHAPLSEIDQGGLCPGVAPRRVKHRVAQVTIVPGPAPVVLYELADGRAFEIQVREVHSQAYAKASRIAVGD